HQILVSIAAGLPTEPRARLLPEERLEAALLLSDEERVRKLIHTEESGLAEARRVYLYRQAPIRNRKLTEELQDLYNGMCQICAWAPRGLYGHDLCHAHHIHWLSRGGADDFENLMLLCPNHHTAIHRCDAPFDFYTGTFIFEDHREYLELNRHLKIWKT